jgi:predicted DNA-binding transcriptional regulator AlpA
MSDGGVGGDKEIRALAEAVVDVLEERGLVAPPEPMPGRVLKVADVAKLLGRGRPWVYEHAAELGAFRFGTGPRARIGFDRDAIERWKRNRQILEPAATSAPTRRRGRSRKNAGSSAANLIPYDPSPYRA